MYAYVIDLCRTCLVRHFHSTSPTNILIISLLCKWLLKVDPNHVSPTNLTQIGFINVMQLVIYGTKKIFLISIYNRYSSIAMVRLPVCKPNTHTFLYIENETKVCEEIMECIMEPSKQNIRQTKEETKTMTGKLSRACMA